MTAGVLKDEQQRAREAGVDAVLTKPMELNQLVATLSRWTPRATTEVWSDTDAVPPIALDALDDGAAVATLPVIAGLDQAHVA